MIFRKLHRSGLCSVTLVKIEKKFFTTTSGIVFINKYFTTDGPASTTSFSPSPQINVNSLCALYFR
ncbi:hypothetical protein L3N51_01906 [Metallosphaera sp. J1]|nr:hypothetical protein [Metallosphaera javensis (ex Hofmann et al. 2022)]BCS93119.1 MAG: hypothetical protein MjAS7_1727 [Metallosphaera javensis (ex Sakai et al. 2022)]